MTTRQIKVYQDLMGENDRWAQQTRELLAKHQVEMVNLIGSPGCGKTALLERLADRQGQDLCFAVLEGDIETINDAQRLARKNIVVSQLLTKGSCHLEAKLVHYALRDLPLAELDLVIVENVGNLVCPAEFDIGEHRKIAMLSVTEGEDKPLKYPLLFREARAAVVSKIDLLPHLTFDLDACVANIRRINSEIPLFQLSSTSGAGVTEFIDWLCTVPSSAEQ
ncbi:MAG: hydrogenase accessory protein HypB [Candidatus Electrothrix sp. AX5]|uniref:Hydrogenase nickel incorporation protein HypB n=1 Tax=Candidatus Electrothrix aarhusensis TaxID=1859131 RepID=A0A444ITK7_9BACT|nr:hydrogenase accessory protein HypB [Candidatus Electrothrix sp. AX5]RWX43945.1 Hydrogenase nickel incorporation protein HypB [Candidatus Electrothrix aarhusensis]